LLVKLIFHMWKVKPKKKIIKKIIWGHYVRVVQKAQKDIFNRQQQKFTNQTKNQPSSLNQTENISTWHF
jgi:hypothetical protein